VKKTIQIQDKLFKHASYSTDFYVSKYIQWNRDIANYELCIFTETHLKKVNSKFKIKIAWLLESPAIMPEHYAWIKENYDKFDYVLTFDKELLDISNKFYFIPIGGCWIREKEQMIWDKHKNVSIIVSKKNQTIGHKLRHQIVNELKSEIDVYGQGYNAIENKIEALKDYRYSIVIENIKKDYYFTEKLIDAFITGTIPIYYGCPSIANFFDVRGMIIINDLEDLKNKLQFFNQENYEKMKPYIIKNFELAKKYLIAEDNIYKFLKNKRII